MIRAYIAASRRTDRSMEARMESARRASDLHQKRTGKKLRITEDIVQNEEMYEEEDPSYEQRARRREQWMIPSYPYASGSNGSFGYPQQPLQFYSFQPENSNPSGLPSINTSIAHSPSLHSAGLYSHSPLSSTAMHFPQHGSTPGSPNFGDAKNGDGSSHTDISQWEQYSKLDKLAEPTSRTSQDISFGFSQILFGDPTMRPSGIQTPLGAFDFGNTSQAEESKAAAAQFNAFTTHMVS